MIIKLTKYKNSSNKKTKKGSFEKHKITNIYDFYIKFSLFFYLKHTFGENI